MLAAVLALVAAVALAVIAPAALAHETGAETTSDHLEEDYVIHTPRKERRLERESAAATADDAAAAAADAAGDPEDVGEWGDVMDWPVVGIHVALMPDGTVLAYDSIGDEPSETYPDETTPQITRAIVWDPADGEITRVDANTGVNVFCSGMAHLMDGTLFVAGGNKNRALDGTSATNVFDFVTRTWHRTANMNYERWYPTVTPLQNGEMLITEGSQTQTFDQGVPEVREVDGRMRALLNAVYQLPLYPWMDVGPNGRVFYTGPDSTMRSLDPSGAGEWRDLGFRDDVDREYGSHAMYDVGKVLVAGGGHPATATARVIDLKGSFPSSLPTEDMESPRRQHNLTVLADGTVLATGGLSSSEEHVDLANAVYTGEIWDPRTGEWTTMAAEDRARQYHSTALLLPDATVLTAGGGICSTCDSAGYLEKSAQVFSPPYLFDEDGNPAARPRITQAPSEVGYDKPLTVTSPEADSIDEVALVRLGSVTHSVNMEQRYVPLDFKTTPEGIVASSPADANTAPPGFYMLFLIDDEGVPSVASMVNVVLPPGPPHVDPPVDSSPPQTRISRAPGKRVSKKRVKFWFTSDDGSASFQCRLDDKQWRRCESPDRIRVRPGRHEFAVRAYDQAGNVDPKPAVDRFRVTDRRRRGK